MLLYAVMAAGAAAVYFYCTNSGNPKKKEEKPIKVEPVVSQKVEIPPKSEKKPVKNDAPKSDPPAPIAPPQTTTPPPSLKPEAIAKNESVRMSPIEPTNSGTIGGNSQYLTPKMGEPALLQNKDTAKSPSQTKIGGSSVYLGLPARITPATYDLGPTRQDAAERPIGGESVKMAPNIPQSNISSAPSGNSAHMAPPGAATVESVRLQSPGTGNEGQNHTIGGQSVRLEPKGGFEQPAAPSVPQNQEAPSAVEKNIGGESVRIIPNIPPSNISSEPNGNSTHMPLPGAAKEESVRIQSPRSWNDGQSHSIGGQSVRLEPKGGFEQRAAPSIPQNPEASSAVEKHIGGESVRIIPNIPQNKISSAPSGNSAHMPLAGAAKEESVRLQSPGNGNEGQNHTIGGQSVRLEPKGEFEQPAAPSVPQNQEVPSIPPAPPTPASIQPAPILPKEELPTPIPVPQDQPPAAVGQEESSVQSQNQGPPPQAAPDSVMLAPKDPKKNDDIGGNSVPLGQATSKSSTSKTKKKGKKSKSKSKDKKKKKSKSKKSVPSQNSEPEPDVKTANEIIGEIKSTPESDVKTANEIGDEPEKGVKTANEIGDEPEKGVRTANEISDQPEANVKTATEIDKDKPESNVSTANEITGNEPKLSQ